ncbi:phospholipase D-like domain-containing protein [Halocalculus aciditolerans]|uniref:Phospholipase n=1 Tax=Halocalculus aciditolerans TaxID=1383812 RepID=A0A830FKD5_9EURY|nr:phospholipase D-like domain-containing protein [Halocalculus aciditolerans]GGL60985.1 phospholipase [Halocalculus aciditolerans]
MRARLARSLRVFLALVLLAACQPPVAATGSANTPTIDAVYPNPTADDDVGEFVVLDVPRNTTLSGYALTDGEGVVDLPNASASGRIAVTPTPNRTRRITDARVLAVPSMLSLANGGETVRLRRGNATVDALTYPDAPEGDVYANASWVTPGRTDRSPVTVRGVNATAFALPDDPERARAFVASANDTLLLAGYTLTSRRLERALYRLRDRGVAVHVLLEGHPIGGIPAREARILSRLARAGITVSVLAGDGDPYAYHHAKYAVVDGERVLVATENWEPQSIGGRGHRGWGVTVDSPRLARELTAIFRSDADSLGARPWRDARSTLTVQNATKSDTHRYPRSFDPQTEPVNATLLVTPDNAGPRLTALLDGAESDIRLEQMSVSDGTLLRRVVAAARRGVRVRILLSDAWYAREKNAATVDRLNRIAARDDLPLRAKLVRPNGRFDAVHAKGLVVDGRTAVVGSLNWNEQARTENRETLLALHDPDAARYYARVFDADWRGGSNELPWPLALVTLLAALTTTAWLRCGVEFERTTRR